MARCAICNHELEVIDNVPDDCPRCSPRGYDLATRFIDIQQHYIRVCRLVRDFNPTLSDNCFDQSRFERMREVFMASRGLTYERHYQDRDDNPAGGVTVGVGFTISWQDGPMRDREQNGAFVEDVIKAALGRLAHYQQSRFRCEFNAAAIDHLVMALRCLEDRTADRNWRGVEGSHDV
jgi:hypothetical protein